MNKYQKIWIWIFLGMFLIPELLFSPVISFVLFLFGIDLNYLMTKFVNQQFFTDNQIFIFIAVMVELLGVLGLLILNIKFNKNKLKNLYSILLFLLIILLTFIFYVGLSFRHGIGF